MKKKIFFIILFICFLGLIVYCLERNPHDFDETECVLCHQGDPSSPNSLARSQTSLVCRNCHVDIFESGFMHPYDVKPEKVQIPRDFPLSSSGLITCSTCHNVHSSYMTAYGIKTSFLRREEKGRAFCASCHTQRSLSGDVGHEFMLGEAHFQSKYISSTIGYEIDKTSKNCISCHDGSYASSVSISTGVWGHSSNYRNKRLGRKHPIGINYEQARLRSGRKTDLMPMSIVDPRIQFFDGKIGCGSCHNPYSSIENDLVMSNRRSALCFACHLVD